MLCNNFPPLIRAVTLLLNANAMLLLLQNLIMMQSQGLKHLNSFCNGMQQTFIRLIKLDVFVDRAFARVSGYNKDAER